MKAIDGEGASEQETAQGWEGAKFPSQGPSGKSGQLCPPAAHPQVLPPLCYGQKIIPSRDA